MVDLSSVRCTNGHTLPVGKAASKFCVICGAPMTVTCPEGHQVRIARFCSVCGAPLSVPGEPGDKGSRAGGEGADEAGPPADAPAAGSGADGERAAASEPVHGRSSRNRLIIFGSALLVLLLAGGVYFAVTELAGSQSGKPTATLTPAPPPTSTSVSSPSSAITPSSSPTPSLPPTLSTTTTITATSTSTTPSTRRSGTTTWVANNVKLPHHGTLRLSINQYEVLPSDNRELTRGFYRLAQRSRELRLLHQDVIPL